MSLALKDVVLRVALEVKLYGAPAYAVCIVELLCNHSLSLTNANMRRESVALTPGQDVTVVSYHGAHCVIVDKLITMKMPSLEAANRWAAELQQSCRQAGDLTVPQLVAPLNTKAHIATQSMPLRGAVPERYIFTIPLGMLGVTTFPEQAEETEKAKVVHLSEESAICLSSSRTGRTPSALASRTTEL